MQEDRTAGAKKHPGHILSGWVAGRVLLAKDQPDQKNGFHAHRLLRGSTGQTISKDDEKTTSTFIVQILR